MQNAGGTDMIYFFGEQVVPPHIAHSKHEKADEDQTACPLPSSNQPAGQPSIFHFV